MTAVPMAGACVLCPFLAQLTTRRRFRCPQWAQILEKGADGFQKCRTSIDLKDKWRNLLKAGRV